MAPSQVTQKLVSQTLSNASWALCVYTVFSPSIRTGHISWFGCKTVEEVTE